MTYLLGFFLGRSLVSCQPSRCRCCCTMPKRSPAKRDFRDNGERKIKKSKEGASSSTSRVDEDLVRSFCLFSVMAPLFTFSRIRGKGLVKKYGGGGGGGGPEQSGGGSSGFEPCPRGGSCNF